MRTGTTAAYCRSGVAAVLAITGVATRVAGLVAEYAGQWVLQEAKPARPITANRMVFFMSEYKNVPEILRNCSSTNELFHVTIP